MTTDHCSGLRNLILSPLLYERYQDAIGKYQTVMTTETQVPVYTTRANERICHCLSKVNVEVDCFAKEGRKQSER